MRDQSMAGGVLRISRHELIVVPCGREIKRIARIVVDEHQIGVVHRQLAESQRAAAVVHVVGEAPVGRRDGVLRLGGAELLENQTVGNPRRRQLSADAWRARRESIVQHLKGITVAKGFAQAPSVRVPADEVGWYLFLAQQALEDPLCLDVNQASRALPFIVGIGDRWKHAARVQGLDRKIKEVLNDRKAEPDGLIFEILVALSYAERGWEVELLKERPPDKSPDMVARKGDKTLYVECKRQSRRAAYAEKERNDFLRLWHAAREVLISKAQWVWMKAAFHVEPVRRSGRSAVRRGAEGTFVKLFYNETLSCWQ